MSRKKKTMGKISLKNKEKVVKKHQLPMDYLIKSSLIKISPIFLFLFFGILLGFDPEFIGLVIGTALRFLIYIIIVSKILSFVLPPEENKTSIFIFSVILSFVAELYLQSYLNFFSYILAIATLYLVDFYEVKVE